MNKTEALAHKWLLQKYSKNEIVYFSTKNPDFYIPKDNKGYEVKRAYFLKNGGIKILLERKQFVKLKEKGNIDILVMSEKTPTPLASIPVDKIQLDDEFFDNIILHWTGKFGESKMTLTIDDDLEAKFRMVAAERFGYKKGCLSKALEEAMKDWINKNEVI